MLNRAESAPYFALYAADVLAGAEEMTHAEFGMFMRLALHSWRRCGLPTDLGRIARLLSVSAEELADVWPIVGEPFEERDGRLVLPWQEDERERLDETSEKRRKAANKRWDAQRQRQRQAEQDARTTASAVQEETPATSTSNACALEVECLAEADAEAVADKSRSVGDQGVAPRAPVREPAAGADRPTEGGAGAGTAPTPGSSGPPHPVLEHPDVVAWRERFYCASTAARLADVDAQLVAAVSEAGTPTADRRVARCTPDILAGLAGDMAASRKQPDDPEAAVVWLLRNVADGKVPRAQRVAAVATVRAEQRQAAATAHRATLPDPAARAEAELLEGRRMMGRFAEDYPQEHARLWRLAESQAPKLRDSAAVAMAIEGMMIPMVRTRLAELKQQPTHQADSESAAHSLAGASA